MKNANFERFIRESLYENPAVCGIFSNEFRIGRKTKELSKDRCVVFPPIACRLQIEHSFHYRVVPFHIIPPILLNSSTPIYSDTHTGRSEASCGTDLMH